MQFLPQRHNSKKNIYSNALLLKTKLSTGRHIQNMMSITVIVFLFLCVASTTNSLFCDGFSNSVPLSSRTCRHESSSHLSLSSSVLQRSNEQKVKTTTAAAAAITSGPCSFPDDIISSLDLVPLIKDVARHTTTRRGYNGLLLLVNQDDDNKKRNSLTSTKMNRRDQILHDLYSTTPSSSSSSMVAPLKRNVDKPLITIPNSLESVLKEYELVKEATILLQQSTDDDNDGKGLSYPPIYGAESDPFDVQTIPDTDDDEWLYLPPNQYTPEHILQAEQVIKILLQVSKWSTQQQIKDLVPNLSNIASQIIDDDSNDDDDSPNNNNVLTSVYEEIEGTIEIVRVRSV